MAVKQSLINNFFLKILLIVWGICCIIYSFTIFQFWWGNHDWSFLKTGISLQDGFFEARYSQHLPNIIFFDGQILPSLGAILSLFFLVLLFLLIAKYLNIPQKSTCYILFIGLLSSLPHTSILFYYVFIMFPLTFWGCFGVGLLFLTEKPYKWWKFILEISGFTLLLGSYPPNLGLFLTLFIGKRMLQYIYQKQTFKETICISSLFLAQLCLAYLCYQGIYNYLEKSGYLNSMMYNLAIRDIKEIFQQTLIEAIFPIIRFSNIIQTYGTMYAVFFYSILFYSISKALLITKNRIVTLFLILGLILASRISFLLSNSAYIAAFRVSWWGQTGLISVCLAILLQKNKAWIKNISFTILSFFICSFIITDYEVQKVQFLAYKAERLFQKRVEERLFSHSSFDLDNNYSTLSFGYPEFHQHFCYKNCQGFNNELLDSTIMPAEFGSVIFWDEIKSPLISKYGLWSNRLWFVGNPILKNHSINVNNIKYWMYTKAQTYPKKDSIYIDDKFIIFVFDPIFFNRYREIAITNLNNI